MIFVFSHERPGMLLNVLKHLDTYEHGHDVTVIDDASTFDFTEHNELAGIYQAEKHLGKPNYWMQWRTAFNLAFHSDDDLFIFTPDDFQDLDLVKIAEIHKELNHRAYCFNLINDGRDQSFRQFKLKPHTIAGVDCSHIGFTDCGFFCNRSTLRLLNFHIRPVNAERFYLDPNRSSGVGEQLTFRMRDSGVFILRPDKSLASHGDHESKMHKEERKKNPLISI